MFENDWLTSWYPRGHHQRGSPASWYQTGWSRLSGTWSRPRRALSARWSRQSQCQRTDPVPVPSLFTGVWVASGEVEEGELTNSFYSDDDRLWLFCLSPPIGQLSWPNLYFPLIPAAYNFLHSYVEWEFLCCGCTICQLGNNCKGLPGIYNKLLKASHPEEGLVDTRNTPTSKYAWFIIIEEERKSLM